MPSFFKKRPAILNKRAIRATKAYQWRELVKIVKVRDGGRCRVCGKPGSDPHHIVFRSHGGKDIESNVILACRNCHQLVHGHAIRLSGTASELTVTRWTDGEAR